MSTAIADIAPAVVSLPRADLARALRVAGTIRSLNVHIAVKDGLVLVAGYHYEAAVRVTFDGFETGPGVPVGEIFVNRATLAKVLPYCGADVQLIIGLERLTIKSDGASVELPAADPEKAHAHEHDFDAPDHTDLTFEAPVLVEAFRRALPFASRDMTRPVLATIALYRHDQAVVATDAYRIAVVRYGDERPDEEPPILIDINAAASMRRLLAKRLGQVHITQGPRHVHAEFDDTEWSCNLRTGNEGKPAEYVQWHMLMPADRPDTTIMIDRDELLAAARLAKAVAPRNAPLRLTAEAGKAAISCGKDYRSACPSSVERSLPSAAVEGQDVEIGLNPEFLADVVAASPVERVELGMISPLRPLKITAARDVYLLMPIRLSV